jgi:hypothetical protein
VYALAQLPRHREQHLPVVEAFVPTLQLTRPRIDVHDAAAIDVHLPQVQVLTLQVLCVYFYKHRPDPRQPHVPTHGRPEPRVRCFQYALARVEELLRALQALYLLPQRSMRV